MHMDQNRKDSPLHAGPPGAAGSAALVRDHGGAPEGAPPAVSVAGRTDRGSRKGRRLAWGISRRVLVLLAIILWIGAVVYPDPRPFASSLSRLTQPPLDAVAVQELAVSLPTDYKVIEDFTLAYVPFAPAWEVYGLPWYFPTVAEVVRDKAGDCQARAILLGSILEAKGMPYTMHYSFNHVWVDYPGKQATFLDDPSTSFIADSGGGWLAGIPDKIPLRSIVEQRWAYHWTPMPLHQKLLIVVGALTLIALGERRLLAGAGGRAAAGGRRAVRMVSRTGTGPSEAG